MKSSGTASTVASEDFRSLSPEALTMHYVLYRLDLYCLEHISPGDRRILGYYFAGRKSFAEISATMELPEETVRTRFSECMSAFQNQATLASKLLFSTLSLIAENDMLRRKVAKLMETIEESTPSPTTNPAERDFLQTPIIDLSISTRLRNALRNAGMRIVQDLIMWNENDFLILRNVGTKTLDELKNFLQEHGLEVNKK